MAHFDECCTEWYYYSGIEKRAAIFVSAADTMRFFIIVVRYRIEPLIILSPLFH